MGEVEQPPVGGVEQFGQDEWDRLVAFADLIEQEGEKRGLVGPRELSRMWTRHILNSTAISEFIPNGKSVVDVGSGAGFPGLILAIIRPDLQLTLVDSMERRCDWLNYATSELGLENVTIRLGRAEDLASEIEADVVTARAVAALKKLLPWTMPLLKPGGSLVALKGIRVDDEIDDAVHVLRKYRAEWADVHVVKTFGSDEETRVLVVKKKG